jgi:hypothetical protein
VTSPLRVFQVASGNVGVEMIKRLANRPDLELVGLHCYSPGKVRRDVGELAGIEPLGVTAIGMTVTGMPALNAIRAVVDAAPGLVTSADLPLRAFAGHFAR